MPDDMAVLLQLVAVVFVIMSPVVAALLLIAGLNYVDKRLKKIAKENYDWGYKQGLKDGYLNGLRDSRPPHFGPYR